MAETQTLPTSSAATDGTTGAEQTPTPDSNMQSVEGEGLDMNAFYEQLGMETPTGTEDTDIDHGATPAGKQAQAPVQDEEQEDDTSTTPEPTDEADQDDDEPSAILSEDDEPSDEGEGDEDADEPTDADEKPQWFQKRIDKLTRQKKEAREQLVSVKKEAEEYKQKLEQTEAKIKDMAHPVMQATPESPFADVLDPSQIDAKVKSAESARQWLINHPQGGEIELENGETMEISPEDASRKRAELDELINKHAPARKEFLAKRGQFQELASKVYPTLLKPGHEHTKIAAGLVQDVPQLLNIPDSTMVLGDYVTGALVRQGAYRLVKATAPDAAKPAQPAAPKRPAAPTPPPEPSATAPSRKPATPAADAARKRAAETGDRDDVIAAFEAMDL